jgi:hypothetical protein
MSLKSKSLARWVVSLSLTFVIGFTLGSFFGDLRTRQTLYQSTGFQVMTYVNALTSIQKKEFSSATKSLEIYTAAGVLLLPHQDALMTSTSQRYVARALSKAKCYGNKYSWKKISAETAKLLTPALQNVECTSEDRL